MDDVFKAVRSGQPALVEFAEKHLTLDNACAKSRAAAMTTFNARGGPNATQVDELAKLFVRLML